VVFRRDEMFSLIWSTWCFVSQQVSVMRDRSIDRCAGVGDKKAEILLTNQPHLTPLVLCLSLDHGARLNYTPAHLSPLSK